MSRPTSHGGGQAGPPIAGDPSSFPTDAELSRTLVAATRIATLSTLTAAGYPYGSVVSYAYDDAGDPVVLISEMAEHTVNARGDDRASMLIVDGAGEGDPLGRARLTLVGRLGVLDDPGELRDRYLEAHPYAAYYADFTDFSFWRLRTEQCRYVGGFGHMSWVSADAYRDAGVDPLWEAAAGIVEHMNGDHADANLAYAQVHAGLPDASEATMLGLDRYGVTLRATTPAGPRMARVPFATPLADAQTARPALIELLSLARAQRDFD
ncbi:HugZ family protein [Candidatus Poriferisodalis sp.]|uniref:HugZ family pyridoxamine 5'-phosphate oxidase n=1 Tax=Candidatus Poriferisodalis sp. TaxID=3101277 RepID=UPI003B02482E